jgi:hypothetical protein
VGVPAVTWYADGEPVSLKVPPKQVERGDTA